jgi:flagellar hook-basal body complex protein FliE
MRTEFIQQIQFGKFDEVSGNSNVEKNADSSMFKGIFEEAVRNVKSTEQELTNQQYLLATGQVEDAHTVMIAASQAQVAVDMLVQLRNKALDSYNELMRISL